MNMDNVPNMALMGGKSYKQRRSVRKSLPRKYHAKLMQHFGGFFEGEGVSPQAPMMIKPSIMTSVTPTMGGKRPLRRSASPIRRRRVGGEEKKEMDGGKKKRPRRVRRVGGEEEKEMEGGKKKRVRRSASPVRRRRVGGEEALSGGKKRRPRRSASPARRR